MQGKKDLVQKLMYQVRLNDLVPPNNFYRLLNRELDLRFLYKATESNIFESVSQGFDDVCRKGHGKRQASGN